MATNDAYDNMLVANAALSKLNTLLEMMKITSAHLGENPQKAPLIEWMDITDMLIDQVTPLFEAMQVIECALNRLSLESKGVQP